MKKAITFAVLFLFTSLFGLNAQAQEITTPLKSEKMKVEIWSDIVCPFCYIGKRHFEAALKEFKHADKIEIVWKSFQLDPEMPAQTEKVTVYEYLAKRKGISIAHSKSLHENVVNMAKSVGLNYNFDIAVVANSFDAHRLIQLAKTKSLGDAAEEELFSAYFTAGRDIGNKETLIELGKKIGLQEIEVNEVLNSDIYSDQVEKDIYEAQQVGVSGVPFFVFDNRYAISGAQPIDLFLKTLEKAFEERNK